MSVPNSILSVLLVVVWLFVLVPMFVNRRPKVMTVSQTALSTRVLFRGGLDKLRHRIRPGIAGDTPLASEDEEFEEESTARRPVAEVFADTAPRSRDMDLDIADEAGFVEDDAPPRRIRERQAREADFAEDDSRNNSGSRDDSGVDDAEVVSIREAEDRRRPDLDEENLEHLAHRLGRGGYNPTMDATAREQRYASRQRLVLGLLIALIAASVLAFTMTSLVWYVAGAIAVVLVGYLAYLRRQVRIEEQIRSRRMARYARSQAPRQGEAQARRPHPEQYRPDRPEQGEHAPPRATRRPQGPRVVAVDEDDPDFVFLSSPQESGLRRASGQ